MAENTTRLVLDVLAEGEYRIALETNNERIGMICAAACGISVAVIFKKPILNALRSLPGLFSSSNNSTDPDIDDVKPGSLLIKLRFFTPDSFLKFLEYYESGLLKEALIKEFAKINILDESLPAEFRECLKGKDAQFDANDVLTVKIRNEKEVENYRDKLNRKTDARHPGVKEEKGKMENSDEKEQSTSKTEEDDLAEGINKVQIQAEDDSVEGDGAEEDGAEEDGAEKNTNTRLLKYEYLKCFLFSGTYGNFKADWPDKTVMVYRLTIDNGTPGVYQVIHNDRQNGHAEIKFINQVEISPKATEIKIEMFISYSPCDNCAKALIGWIEKLGEQNRREIGKTVSREQKKLVSIAIKFSTFYKNETDGLIKLGHHGITLDVFRGEEAWKKFFQCIGRTDFTAFVQHIRQRKGREDDDYTKLEAIKKRIKVKMEDRKKEDARKLQVFAKGDDSKKAEGDLEEDDSEEGDSEEDDSVEVEVFAKGDDSKKAEGDSEEDDSVEVEEGDDSEKKKKKVIPKKKQGRI